MRNAAILFVLTFLLAAISCGKKKEPLPVSAGNITAPVQRFDSSTLVFYEGKHKRWKLESTFMRKPLTDTGVLLVVPVKLTLYDSLGVPHTKVLADSGTTTQSLERFLVWGNVYIRNRDSLIVKTQKLWWIKRTSRVASDTHVQIETVSGDVLRGKGLDAVEDFSTFSFKSQVSGRFPDFKRRMEIGDDTFF